ncbi:MAG TPA: lytic murein transglycosylase, partial [Aestuariivirga sp.]|nr:lytic murein transglycosylase [Aestuariivirga sp.]
MLKRHLATALAIVVLAAPAAAATCGNSAKGFDQWLKSFRAEAAANGLSRRAIAALDDVEYDPVIVKKDRAQNVFSQSFLEFSGRMVSDYRIKQGAALVKKHKRIFGRV